MMLLDVDHREAVGIRIRRHVQGGGVAVGLGPAVGGVPAHVEPQDRVDPAHCSQPCGVKRTGTRV